MLKVEALVCPKCGAENVGREKHIELERGEAFCNQCSHRGKVSEFQQEK